MNVFRKPKCVYFMYGCLFWSLKTLGASFPKNLGGENPSLQNPRFTPFCVIQKPSKI